jgi:hypothetical protein
MKYTKFSGIWCNNRLKGEFRLSSSGNDGSGQAIAMQKGQAGPAP